MNFALKPIVLAMLVATTQIAGTAYAQAPNAPAAPAVQPAPAATKTPISTRAPEDWIVYDDTTYTPVVDDVSRHLDAARKAIDAKDTKKAATEMRAVAEALKLRAARAGNEDRALVKADKALVAADTKFAQDSQNSIKRMNANALKVSSISTGIESGKIKTKADLDNAIDKAARADLERRWLVTDVAPGTRSARSRSATSRTRLRPMPGRTTRPRPPTSARRLATCASRPAAPPETPNRHSTARLRNSARSPPRSKKAR